MTIAKSLAAGACASVLALGCAAAAYAGPPSSPPNASAASDLYQAGGTPGSFSTVRALTTMLGDAGAKAEIIKLKTQYGGPAIDQFEQVSDFAMNDAWQRAGTANVEFPKPVVLSGRDLATSVLRAGTVADGTFEMPSFLNNLLTKDVHAQVMTDIGAKFGPDAGAAYHRIGNQLFYDIAQSVGQASVKLASDH